MVIWNNNQYFQNGENILFRLEKLLFSRDQHSSVECVEVFV